MAVTTLENIRFAEHKKSSSYEQVAWHGKVQASILRAQLIVANTRWVSLDRIQTLPDYRNIGIAEQLVQGAVAWSRKQRAESIGGYILASALLEDNPVHVAAFLQKLGFIVDGNDFQMDFPENITNPVRKTV